MLTQLSSNFKHKQEWFPQQQSPRRVPSQQAEWSNKSSISQVQNWIVLSVMWQKYLICSFIKGILSQDGLYWKAQGRD